MTPQTTKLDQIEDFLRQKRVALVGVSTHPTDFSRVLFREFLYRGYDMVPVHPGEAEIEGRHCYSHLRDIQPPVDGALFMTPPEVTAQLVEECAEAGIKRVWMFRGAGTGAATANTVARCEDKGMTVIPGECPFMFLPKTSWFHRIHGWVRKMRGTYPECDCE